MADKDVPPDEVENDPREENENTPVTAVFGYSLIPIISHDTHPKHKGFTDPSNEAFTSFWKNPVALLGNSQKVWQNPWF